MSNYQRKRDSIAKSIRIENNSSTAGKFLHLHQKKRWHDESIWFIHWKLGVFSWKKYYLLFKVIWLNLSFHIKHRAWPWTEQGIQLRCSRSLQQLQPRFQMNTTSWFYFRNTVLEFMLFRIVESHKRWSLFNWYLFKFKWVRYQNFYQIFKTKWFR